LKIKLLRLVPPKFWYQKNHWLGHLLEPLGWFYQWGSGIYQKNAIPYQAPVPIISVGNLVLGGAGKTPVTIALSKHLQTLGYLPHIVSRGYGGSLVGPIQVCPSTHRFQDVGDEPLLLAEVAPTWVAKDRAAAVKNAVQAGANIILLDDGHQNYSLVKDMSFIVVNSAQGFGNGRIFPAGPLRQSLQSGLKNTHAIIFIGHENDRLPAQLSQYYGGPIIHASVRPLTPTPCSVVAFAGIGYPEKFHQTLLEAGYQVKDFFPFPDHYPYQDEDLQKLKAKAHLAKVILMTTEKDLMRIPTSGRNGISTLPVYVEFKDESHLTHLLQKLLGRVIN